MSEYHDYRPEVRAMDAQEIKRELVRLGDYMPILDQRDQEILWYASELIQTPTPQPLVKNVFARAYGEVPYPELDIVISLHVGNWNGPEVVPTILVDWNRHSEYMPPNHCVFEWNGDTWMPVGDHEFDVIGPDISNEPAAPFAGFFDDRYRKALDELKEGV